MKNRCLGSQRPLLWGWIISALTVIAQAQPDPCSQVWRVTFPTLALPSAHPSYAVYEQGTAYDSRRRVLVFFGGKLSNQAKASDADTFEWDGVQWKRPSTFGSTLPPPRVGSAMAYDEARGVCVMFGGEVWTGNQMYNDTYEWDGSQWAFRQAFDPTATDRPSPMAFHVMAYDSDRKKTVLFGDDSARTWEWDGTNWSFQLTINPPQPQRMESAMVYDPTRHVSVLFGGRTASYQPLGDTRTWNGTKWTVVATDGPLPRFGHAMAYDARRKVIVLFGGRTNRFGEDNILGDTWEWNGHSWSPHPDAGRLGLGRRVGSTMWYDSVDQKLNLYGGGPGDFLSGGYHTNDLWAARAPGYWVDFNASGLPSFPETGYFNEPYNTLSEAVSAATAGCTVNLKAGSRAEVITITKPLTLEAYYGTVTIGQ